MRFKNSTETTNGWWLGHGGPFYGAVDQFNGQEHDHHKIHIQ